MGLPPLRPSQLIGVMSERSGGKPPFLTSILLRILVTINCAAGMFCYWFALLLSILLLCCFGRSAAIEPA